MRRVGGRSIANALIFTALLGEFVFLVGHLLFGWGTTTYPPTPRQLEFQPPSPPSGTDVLLRLSAVAAERRAPAWPAGRPYAYVRLRSWRLRDRGARTRLTPITFGSWRQRNEVPALPGATAPLARLLSAGERRDGSAPGWEVVAFTHLTQTEPVAPTIQVRLLRLLARIPGMVNDGTTTDRAGRSGLAVSLDSSYSGEPITYTLVFDPDTGALLESDETLAAPPHKLNALQGSVVSYTTFLASGYVASEHATP